MKYDVRDTGPSTNLKSQSNTKNTYNDHETFSEFTEVTQGMNIDGLSRINNTLRSELETVINQMEK